MSGELAPNVLPDPDAASTSDARALALTGPELEAIEAHLPSDPEQEILDYARGAHIGLPEIVALTVDAGAWVAMHEHQGRAIASLQARLLRVLAALEQAKAKDGA